MLSAILKEVYNAYRRMLKTLVDTANAGTQVANAAIKALTSLILFTLLLLAIVIHAIAIVVQQIIISLPKLLPFWISIRNTFFYRFLGIPMWLWLAVIAAVAYVVKPKPSVIYTVKDSEGSGEA